eukprot:11452782-Alexandrium_andersonii.AAC.1
MPSLLSPSRLPDRPLLQTGWLGTCFNAKLLLGGETQTPCASIASATVAVLGAGVNRLAVPQSALRERAGRTGVKCDHGDLRPKLDSSPDPQSG